MVCPPFLLPLPLPLPLPPSPFPPTLTKKQDTLKSTLHRVGLPPKQDRFTGDERMTRERYSIPYFVSPNGEHVVECLDTCIDEKHPAKYEPIKWNDYMMMRASMQY